MDALDNLFLKLKQYEADMQRYSNGDEKMPFIFIRDDLDLVSTCIEPAQKQLASLRAERDEAVRLLKEIHSMNDMANLNDAELWNVNGEFEKRIVALIRDSSEPVQND
jgi:hypothetical protein